MIDHTIDSYTTISCNCIFNMPYHDKLKIQLRHVNTFAMPRCIHTVDQTAHRFEAPASDLLKTNNPITNPMNVPRKIDSKQKECSTERFKESTI